MPAKANNIYRAYYVGFVTRDAYFKSLNSVFICLYKSRQRRKIVASPRNANNPTISVIVVKITLPAIAGSI